MNDHETVKREKNWIQQHTISFAFKGDQFLPNPDSMLFANKFKIDKYKQYPLSETD